MTESSRFARDFLSTASPASWASSQEDQLVPVCLRGPALEMKVPHPRSPLRAMQTGMAGYPTWRRHDACNVL